MDQGHFSFPYNSETFLPFIRYFTAVITSVYFHIRKASSADLLTKYNHKKRDLLKIRSNTANPEVGAYEVTDGLFSVS